MANLTLAIDEGLLDEVRRLANEREPKAVIGPRTWTRNDLHAR